MQAGNLLPPVLRVMIEVCCQMVLGRTFATLQLPALEASGLPLVHAVFNVMEQEVHLSLKAYPAMVEACHTRGLLLIMPYISI